MIGVADSGQLKNLRGLQCSVNIALTGCCNLVKRFEAPCTKDDFLRSMNYAVLTAVLELDCFRNEGRRLVVRGKNSVDSCRSEDSQVRSFTVRQVKGLCDRSMTEPRL